MVDLKRAALLVYMQFGPLQFCAKVRGAKSLLASLYNFNKAACLSWLMSFPVNLFLMILKFFIRLLVTSECSGSKVKYSFSLLSNLFLIK